MKKSNKVLAFILAVILSFSVFNIMPFAAAEELSTTEAAPEDTGSEPFNFLDFLKKIVAYVKNFFEYIFNIGQPEPEETTTQEPTTQEPTENIIFVAPEADMQAAANDAKEGDTLVLLAGDHTATSDMIIDKALSLISEEGATLNIPVGSSLVLATDGITVENCNFKVNGVDIRITAPENTYDAVELSNKNNGAYVVNEAAETVACAVYGSAVNNVITIKPGDQVYKKLAEAASGDLVIIQEGLYTTSTTLNIANKKLYFRGEGEVVIQKNANSSDSNRQLLTITGRPDGELADGCVVDNIVFDAAKTKTVGSLNTIPINIISADVTLMNVTAKNSAAAGIIVSGKYHSTTVTAYNVTTENNSYSVDVDGSNKATTTTFIYDTTTCVFNESYKFMKGAYGIVIAN